MFDMDHVSHSASHIFYIWRNWPKNIQIEAFRYLFFLETQKRQYCLCVEFALECSLSWEWFVFVICLTRLDRRKGVYKGRQTSYDLKTEKETTKIVCNIAKWFTEILCFIMSLREKRNIPSQPLCSHNIDSVSHYVHCYIESLRKSHYKDNKKISAS